MTLFGTNVKMHQTATESRAFIDALALFQPPADVQMFTILPFTSLPAIVEPARRAGIWVGAQNMHAAVDGEYTGEVSAPMLADIGVDLVLLGHAERRRLFHEDDVTIGRKVETALAHGLRVLLCVGETAAEKACGAGPESVVRQLKMSLHGVADLRRVIVAYEPVWAIGEAGTEAGPADIAPQLAAIRAAIDGVPLVYGGSVTEGSARRYAELAEIDGLFVGRAARSAAGFCHVLEAAYRMPREKERAHE